MMYGTVTVKYLGSSYSKGSRYSAKGFMGRVEVSRDALKNAYDGRLEALKVYINKHMKYLAVNVDEEVKNWVAGENPDGSFVFVKFK